uniref:G-protein coupled receptors family 1 profile domain-containing protein n=1 Tax=Parascaris equorum TaxID=6256 RepID=A0A914RJG0_PAREQ
MKTKSRRKMPLFSSDSYVLYTFWPFGTATCKIAGSLQGFGIFLSTFSIAAIALDRYVLVIFPTKRKRQHNLSLLFFSLIWLISIALALPLLIASDLNTIFEDHNCDISLRICHEKNEIWQQMPIGKEAYTLAVLVTQYALPLISIVFAYTRIAHRMQGQFAVRMSSCANSLAIMSHRRRSVVERQRRTHLLLMCVVIMFAVAWLPLNVFHVLNTFGIVKADTTPDRIGQRSDRSLSRIVAVAHIC